MSVAAMVTGGVWVGSGVGRFPAGKLALTLPHTRWNCDSRHSLFPVFEAKQQLGRMQRQQLFIVRSQLIVAKVDIGGRGQDKFICMKPVEGKVII